MTKKKLPPLIPVESSNIAGYHYSGTDLTIGFKSGGTYKYAGVKPETVAKFAEAKSKGKFLNNKIVSRHKAVKL